MPADSVEMVDFLLTVLLKWFVASFVARGNLAHLLEGNFLAGNSLGADSTYFASAAPVADEVVPY